MRKANVYIDGGYIDKISKHFGSGKYLKIDYFRLANNMTRDLGYWCFERYYYTAPPFQSNPPTMDESRRKSGYDRVISKMKRYPNFIVKEGRLQKVNNEFHQKGVDTLITMDLMRLLDKQNKVKTAILLTCDTDFVPVLQTLRDNGIEIILYYFSDFIRGSPFSMSDHILTVVDKKILITDFFMKKSLLS
jgi:uncharacterized LabA/DUF88 family protein